MSKLTFGRLRRAVAGESVALRSRTTLQPAGGWYDGDGGITTIREQAERLTASGTAIKNIAIKLPAPREDLPSIQC